MASPATPPLMKMMETHMRYLTQRQSVLAQNVANLDTPGYKGQDLKKVNFSDLASAEGQRLSMRTTSGKHLASNNGSGIFARAENRDGFEVTPTGNSVSLEQEMAKISETGSNYQLTSSMYRKFTQMYRSALGNR